MLTINLINQKRITFTIKKQISINTISISNILLLNNRLFLFRKSMQVQNQNQYLPLDIAIKYYRKWDCDISCKIQDGLYFKYLNGNGSVEYQNGNSYCGAFKNGHMNGKGTYKWKNGLMYEGIMKNNTVTGDGKLTWPDGSYYIGSVVEGKREGLGEYYCMIDKSNYKGDWKKGLKHGRGVLNFSNGSTYEGEFKEGVRQGAGKMKYQSGNEYQGNWLSDKKSGNGTMNWYSSFEKYEGNWKDDMPNGSGSYYWYEGKNESKSIKTIYKGNWKNGKRDGFGSFFYNNGCRLQGTFKDNLKEGMCFIVDQFGDGHIQYFKGDKSVSKKQQIALKQQKKHLKLPQISQSSTKKQNILQNNEPTQNNYSKFIDIESDLIDDSIYNLLLRQNSQLRQWYKIIVNNINKQIFNGLNIEGLWRVVKDLKMTDQSITIAKLNRQFYKGQKSFFEMELPNKEKLQLIKTHSHLLTNQNYQTIQWKVYYQNIIKLTLDWNNWPEFKKQANIENVSLHKALDIHDNNQIMLFRHFIVYILQLNLQQFNQNSCSNKTLTFRKCLEDLFTSIKTVITPAPIFKTEKVCSEVITNLSHNQSKLHISQEYSVINKTLFTQLNKQKAQLLNIIDHSVTVKQIYCLLCQCGLLKEPSQKMLFLQKIQRNMNVKSSLLKKQNKNYFSSFQKIVLTSPHFSHIMNYEMIESEFDEIIYILLNRKIGNTQCKQQFMKKYKEIIKSMTTEVSRVREESINFKKTVKFNWNRKSYKDRMKEQLITRIEEQRQIKLEQQRKIKEQKRQERQRKLMKRQDVNINDDEELEQSEQYYD